MARTEQVGSCLLCATAGRVLYPEVRDQLFGHEGRFGELVCPECGLIWLSPRPVQEDIGKFYQDYYTHSFPGDHRRSEENRRFLGDLRDALREMILCGYYGYRALHTRHRFCSFGKLLGRVHFMRLRATSDLKELIPHYRPGALVLDIGCGRGDFLGAMKRLGWNVLGIEMDPVSAAIARSRGIPVQIGSFDPADIAAESVDHITMNHVIEHFYDPIAVIRKCSQLLKVGGTMVLYAPNAQGLGHRLFGRHWLALDPPRHLYTYACRNLRVLLGKGGFTRVTIKTSARLAPGIFDTSRAFQGGVTTKGQAPPPQAGRQWFAFRERLSCALGLNRGEEIVAFTSKCG
jgi:2-polyprenyl-3-methyl-5-hydroxy-6-metoxy-1,4-benzoquinol methylase